MLGLVGNQILKAHLPMAVCLPLQIFLLHVGEDAVLLFRRGLLGIEPSVEPVEGGGEFGRILVGEFCDCHNGFFCVVNLKFKELSHNKRFLSRVFLKKIPRQKWVFLDNFDNPENIAVLSEQDVVHL